MAAVHSGSGDGGFAFGLLQPQMKSPLFIPALLPPTGCPGVHYVTVPAPSFFPPLVICFQGGSKRLSGSTAHFVSADHKRSGAHIYSFTWCCRVFYSTNATV